MKIIEDNEITAEYFKFEGTGLKKTNLLLNKSGEVGRCPRTGKN